MNTLKLLMIAAIAVFMAGCYTLSLHPLYSDEDVVFDSLLVGIWGDPENSNETWAFEKSGDNAYLMVIRDQGVIQTSSKSKKDNFKLVMDIDPEKDGKFQVHMVQLGEYLFLDLFPVEPKHENDFFKSHVIQAHSFVRVWLKGDTLELAALDKKWLKESIDQKKIDIKHERLKNTIVLTASTEELQAFVIDYINEAFSEIDKAYRLN